MRKSFKKLEYEPLDIDGITFYVAKSRVKNSRIVVKRDGKPYAVCSIYESKSNFEKFLREHIDWVRKSIDKIKCNLPYDVPVYTKDEKRRLVEKLQKYISIYEKEMGVKVNNWQVRKMITRWGSCTSKKRTIRFSTELCRCNDMFIEYIVVHEMAHFFEANHQERFWKIVEKYIPNYKYIKKNKYL